MQVYAMKFHNFLRFGEKNNTIVFDLTASQKKGLKDGSVTMDEIYEDVKKDPISHIKNAKERGIERQLGIIGLVNGNADISNGVGKSSIMEGICYAHYEKIVRKTRNSDKIEKAGLSVVTKINGKYPSGLKESYVEEFLEDNGRAYRIKRGRNFASTQKSSTPLLEFECFNKDGADSLSGHRTADTKDAISDVITQDYDVFVNSQMFGQNDAGKYLTGGDKTRKEMLISLLHLENVVVGCLELLRKKKNTQDKLVQSIQSNINFLEDMFNKAYVGYSAMLDLDVADGQIKIDSPQGLIKAITAIQNKCYGKIKVCDDNIKSSQDEIDTLSKSEPLTRLSQIMEEGKSCKKQKKDKEEECARQITDWDKLQKDSESELIRQKALVKSKEDKIAKMIEQKLASQSKIKSFNKSEKENKLAELKKEIDKSLSVKQLIPDAKIKIEVKVGEISKLQSKIQDYKAAKGKLQEQLKKGDSFICSECKMKVTKEHIETRLKEAESAINERENALNVVTEALKEDKMFLSSLEGKVSVCSQSQIEQNNILSEFKSFTECHERIKEIDGMIVDSKLEMDSASKSIVNLEEKSKEYKNKCVEIEIRFKSDIEAISKRLSELSQKYKQADIEVATIKTNIEENKKKKEEYSQKKQKYSEKVGSLAKELDNYSKLKTNMEEKRMEFEKEGKTLNRMLLLEEIYGLEGIQTRIVKKYLPLLNVYIKEFLDILSHGEMVVKMIINDSSKVDLDITGGSADTYEMLSGGEQMIVRLAVDIGLALLSFSRSTQKPEIICLDEIFGPLDNSHTESVFKMLKRLEDRFSRVLIITHKPEIQLHMKNNIILEKEAGMYGLSEIKRIE